MIPTHLTFNLRSRTVVFVALLVAAISGCVHLWAAAADTPIIIADGSLTIESRGVPWDSYSNSAEHEGAPAHRKIRPPGGDRHARQ